LNETIELGGATSTGLPKDNDLFKELATITILSLFNQTEVEASWNEKELADTRAALRDYLYNQYGEIVSETRGMMRSTTVGTDVDLPMVAQLCEKVTVMGFDLRDVAKRLLQHGLKESFAKKQGRRGG
jgi:hypothetical protein